MHFFIFHFSYIICHLSHYHIICYWYNVYKKLSFVWLKALDKVLWMGTDAQFLIDVHHHYQPISLIRSAKTREERRVALARPAPPLLSWAEAPRPVEELGPPEYLAVVENPPPVAESLLHVVELLLALTSGGKLSFCKRWLREATQDQIVCFLNIGGYLAI